MRTPFALVLAAFLCACGPSGDEGADAEAARAKVASTAAAGPAEAPVDLGEGLILTVLQRGTGTFVPSGGRVRVHYDADVVAVAPEPGAETPADEPQAVEASAAETPAAGAPEVEAVSEEPAAEVEAPAEVAEATTDGAAEPAPAQAEDAPEAPEAPEATDGAPVAPTEPSAPAAEAPPEFPRRFDSSRARGVPDAWDLSRTASPRLIEGLRRGLVGLTAGSRVTLRIPATLAWGDAGLPDAGVPPRAEILYEIELIEVLP
jgi:hypothetical protein